MDDVRVVPPGGGEVVGDSADRRVEILSDDETLNATWSRFGPRREGADLHVHREHTDLFYVLQGELTLRLGLEDDAVVAPAGTLVRVPPLVVHGFRNGSAAEVRYLNFHAPGMRFADYLRAVRERRPFSYDQHDPPDDPRPAAEASIGGTDAVEEEDGLRVATLADGGHIAVAEVTRAPSSPSRLVRHDVLESFFVLEGELELTTAGAGRRAPAGSWAQVDRGVAHAVAAAGDTPARYLRIRTPGGAR